MADPKLRFTGEDPPQHLWPRYPNWEPAWDEEGEDGQDETTLRPSAIQDIVDPDATLTAAVARLADGRQFPALVELTERNASGVQVFVAEGSSWSVRELGAPARWTPVVYDWLPVAEQGPSVSLSDDTVFPLLVTLQVPHARGGQPQAFRILPNGTAAIAG